MPNRGRSRCAERASARSVCTPGSIRIDIADLILHPLIQRHQKIDRAHRARGTLAREPESSGPAGSVSRKGRRSRAARRRVKGIFSAYGSRKKSNGLKTAISATRSTSTENSVVGSGKPGAPDSCPAGPAAS